MAQCTGHDTIRDCKLEYSIDAVAWTDMSGYANSIAADGAEVAVGEAYTFDGDYALLGAGKVSPVDITFNVVYTENVANPFNVIRAYKHARTPLYVRYSPKGGDATEWQYESGAGYIRSLPDPGGEPNDGTPMLVTCIVRVPKLTRNTIGS